jgi:hypothetical protein
MEEPVRFDARANFVRPLPDDALAWLRRFQKGISELDGRKLLQQGSVQGSSDVLLARGLGWSEARELRVDAPAWVVNLRLFQEGYGPEETGQHCSVHDLHYGGCLGCPVCSDFHAR